MKIGDEIGYIWIMNEFVDDTYLCPEATLCSPAVFSKTEKGIFNNQDSNINLEISFYIL